MKRALALLLLALAACQAPADASVLLDLAAFNDNDLPALRAPAATLEVLDGAGEAAAVTVLSEVDEPLLVQSPLPVPCERSGVCAIDVRLSPGAYRFVLHVDGADRCGTRGELLQLSSGPESIALSPYQAETVQLELERADFDDDDDAIPNILDVAVCGRLDVRDGAASPAACLDRGDPCCAGVSGLEGRRSAFAGGAHVRADGSTVTVAPFALDDTEVTWRQLARCVAAGHCLANQPNHPARQTLAAGVDLNVPVTGLVPSEAAELCAFFGARLPRDDEWDFAAAHRDGEARARYPWDDLEDIAAHASLLRRVKRIDDAIGCRPEDSFIAANHRARGRDCLDAPLPVGSFLRSLVVRGAGLPIADLGGNVAEWTLVEGNPPATIDEVPAGHVAAVLRGGGATSFIELLENDLPIVARFPSSGDTQAWAQTIRRLAVDAGFRCAIDVEDGNVAPAFEGEPSCGP